MIEQGPTQLEAVITNDCSAAKRINHPEASTVGLRARHRTKHANLIYSLSIYVYVFVLISVLESLTRNQISGGVVGSWSFCVMKYEVTPVREGR